MSGYIDADRLYNLLPAIHRIRDEEQGGPLKALVTSLAEQLAGMELDIEQLGENWFIETCQEWVVPYIGELVGVKGLHAGVEGIFSQRAYVANTIRYRRRKGTAPMLEQLSRDITGWPARAVEFFQLLETTQHINHTRIDNYRTPDLRDTNQLELLDTPFDTIAHTGDVRSIEKGRGKHNIPNIGLFLWRLRSYGVSRARAVASSELGGFFLNPLGVDMPLFNKPHTETEISHLAEEINVPGKLRRRPLYDELESRRETLTEGGTPEELYFDEDRQVFRFYLDNEEDYLAPEEIMICDLSDWRRLPAGSPMRVAIDPVLGRATVPEDSAVNTLEGDYQYGFSSDLGGGPYDRTKWIDSYDMDDADFLIGVSKRLQASPDDTIVETIGEAITAWQSQPSGAKGVIALLDSDTYEEDVTVEIPEGSRLLIVAATCPEEEIEGSPGTKLSYVARWSADINRPYLKGKLSARGTAPGSSLNPGDLVVNGLLIRNEVTVLVGNLGRLQIDHCTLVPNTSHLIVNQSVDPTKQNRELKVHLDRTISGYLQVADTISELLLAESIVESTSHSAVTANGSPVRVKGSTFFGTVEVESLEASDSIFNDDVTVERRQEGCVRFCYVTHDSQLPRRYRCQPDLAIEEAEKEKGSELEDAEKELIRKRVRPRFNEKNFIDSDTARSDFAQLGLSCPEEIATGGEDGSEMGAFYHLKQPLRESNLKTSLDEYLRVGMEAGIFYAT